MNASKLILTSALLALTADGLTSTALGAQCSQARQRNWNAQFAWEDDVAF